MPTQSPGDSAERREEREPLDVPQYSGTSLGLKPPAATEAALATVALAVAAQRRVAC